MKLSAAQQDYLEVIYRLEESHGTGSVRISDIAEQLGTRLPTVSRTVARLTQAGLLAHVSRGAVSLTADGKRAAAEVAHRHDDLTIFFRDILGLDSDEAESNACQLEHGLSNKAAQRLHEFLDYLEQLNQEQQIIIKRFARRTSERTPDFRHLKYDKAGGWRV